MQVGAARVPVFNCVGPHSSIVAIITSAPSEARLLRGVSFSFCREIASVTSLRRIVPSAPTLSRYLMRDQTVDRQVLAPGGLTNVE
jgi:hypothetical protein